MKPGDIVLVRFPKSDLQEGKLRPALIIAVAPGKHPDVLLALMTSRTYQAVPKFDEIIEPTDEDFSDTNLKTSSVVRLGRLVSVETSVINAKLGNISKDRLDGIHSRLADWLKK